MKAIRQYEFGDADTLRYSDVPDPVPAAGQVRVRVAVAGMHLVDTTIRSGSKDGPPLPALPMTPGREVAGVVDAVGPGVEESWLGTRVAAHLGQANGGYAALAVAPVTSLHALPDTLSDEAAVALIGTGRTTLAILELAALGPDDVVLIPAAAGGIGALLSQAARRAGAYSVGLASTAKLPYVTTDLVVDYTEPDWPAALADREPTVLLDGVGGAPGRQAFELVGVGGRVVLFGWSAGAPFELTVADLYRQGLTVSCAIGPRIFRRGLRHWEAEALALGASDAWTPLVGPPFPLSDAAAGHRAMEQRRTVGKSVLVP